ncbi:MAG: serine/threonine-protein kinase, partial [Planctomycetota bacterium]
MSSEKKDLRAIFDSALDIIDPAERAGYLDKACGDDAALRSQVEALLAEAGSDTTFLASPAIAPQDPESDQTLDVNSSSRVASLETTPPPPAAGETTDLSSPTPLRGDASPDDATIDSDPLLSSSPDDPTIDTGASPKKMSRGKRLRYFGQYEILGEIARGGMGVVYKARQMNLDRIVAVKMILAGELASRDDIRRFFIEAEAAARLKHPGIVGIHEVGDHEGQHYFSMDYIEGTSLAGEIREKPLSGRDAATISAAIAEAVGYAHEQGVIHRDIKPANILLDENRSPYVTDFGLARRIEGGSELTRSGSVLGTPSYMPPEQAEGKIKELGPAADIYSLGALLYHLTTGVPPFLADSALETVRQVVEKSPVAPRLHNAAIPLDLETIILHCLEKNPAKRYPTARALAEDLERFLHGEPIVARPIGNGERFVRWCKRNPVVAGLSATAALLLVAITLVSTFASIELRDLADRESRSADASHRRLVRLQVVRGNQESETTRSLPWYAQALKLEAEREEPDVSSLIRAGTLLRSSPRLDVSWLNQGDPLFTAVATQDGKHIQASKVRSTSRLTPGDSSCESGPEIRVPEGTYLSKTYSSRRGEYSVFCYRKIGLGPGFMTAVCQIYDATSGEKVGPVIDGKSPMYEVDFHPNAERVVLGEGNPPYDAKMQRLPDGGRARIIEVKSGTVLRTLAHPAFVSSVEYSLNGRHILTGCNDGKIRVWDAESGAELKLFEGTEGGALAKFSRDGSTILAIYGPRGHDGGRAQGVTPTNTSVRVWDAVTFEPKGPAIPTSSGARLFTLSDDGRLIVGHESLKTLAIWNASTGKTIGDTIALNDHLAGNPAISPDSRAAIWGDSGRIHWRSLLGARARTLVGDHSQSLVMQGDGKLHGIDAHARRLTLGGFHSLKVVDLAASFSGHRYRIVEDDIRQLEVFPDSSCDVLIGGKNHLTIGHPQLPRSQVHIELESPLWGVQLGDNEIFAVCEREFV